MAYEEAYELQLKVLAEVQQGGEDTLILVEHPKVITLGRNANPENLLLPEALLEAQGYALKPIERGGDATYHGPGQLVGYTLFNLRERHRGGVKHFVHLLEETFIEVLAGFHLEGRRDEANAGVFIGDNKIAAIGLAIKRGVSLHGFAFNVNTNLSDYEVIVPCGLKDKGVTSLKQELGQDQSLQEVSQRMIQSFQHIYGYSDVDILER